MKQEELEAIGRQWLALVDLVKQAGIDREHDHVRFRDSDLSVKGAALLGFAGLMLAADLVFLSAGKESFIYPDRSCGIVGVIALFVLVAGAFCAAISILISRKGTYGSAWASFGLMKLYLDRRRRWLDASGLITCLGTLVYLLSIAGQLAVGACRPS
jgi:hypothetical protein